MATIQEAQVQVQQAKQILQSQKKQVEERIKSLSSQQEVRSSQSIGSLTQRELSLRQLGSARSNIASSEQQVKQFEGEIKRAQDIQAQIDRDRATTEEAVKLYTRSQMGRPVGLSGRDPLVLEKFRALEQTYSESIDRQKARFSSPQFSISSTQPQTINPNQLQSIEPTMSYASPSDYKIQSTPQMSYASPSDYAKQQSSISKMLANVRTTVSEFRPGVPSTINIQTQQAPTYAEFLAGQSLPGKERYATIGQYASTFTPQRITAPVEYVSTTLLPYETKALGRKVEIRAQELNVPTITQTVPAYTVPQKSTLTYQGSAPSSFTIPERKYDVLSPQVVASGAKTGLTLAAYSTPYLGSALLTGDVASGIRSGNYGAAAIGTGFLAAGTGLKLIAPEIKMIPRGETKTTFQAVVQPVIKEEKQMLQLGVKSTTKVPEQLATYTTPFRKLTKQPPVEFVAQKAKTYEARTIEGFPLLLSNEGRTLEPGLIKVKNVERKPITFQMIQTEERQFSRAGELSLLAEAKLGRPIPRQFASSILKSDIIPERQLTTSQKLAKLSPAKRDITFFPFAQIKKSESIMESVPIKQIPKTKMVDNILVTKLVQVPENVQAYKVKVVEREFNIPFARGTRPTFAKGEVIIKEPIDLTPQELFGSNTLKQIPKLDNEQTLKSIEQTLGKITNPKNIPKQASGLPPSISKPFKELKSTISLADRNIKLGSGLPSYVGGTNYVPPTITNVNIKAPRLDEEVIRMPSITGSAVEERRPVMSSATQKDFINLNTNQKNIQSESLKIDTTPKSQINILELGMTKTRQSDIVLPKIKSNERTSIKEDQVLRSELKLNQIQRQETKQVSKLVTKQESTTTKEKVIKVPRIKVPATSKVDRQSRIEKILTKLPKEAFEVQVRKRGKYEKIGEGLTKGEAMKLGSSEVEKTLRASFRLVPKGTTSRPDIDFKLPQEKFTLPKPSSPINAPLTYVEKPTYRLSTKTEVSEILKAKGGYLK